MFRFIIFLGILVFPVLVSADVIINEIAWMGNESSSNDEFIELYNNNSTSISLDGWSITATDGSPSIILSGSIAAGGYFLLERSDDDSVPGVTADAIYTGALGNGGEDIILKDGSGSSIDILSYGDGWPAGDNTTKETMQRTGQSSDGWITALRTPRALNASTGTSSSVPPPEEKSESSNESNNETYIPPENLPHITASAGKDRTVIVGESIIFEGSAFGIEGSILENPRYVWSFGDAAIQEGKKISYAYAYPGVYIVRLSVSSGKFSAIDDVRITVVPGSVSISEVKPGANGWVELVNRNSKEVHIGGWMLEIGVPGTRFVFPTGMLISGQARTVIMSTTTHLPLFETSGSVRLLYPNGEESDVLSYVMYVSEEKSVSKNGNYITLTDPTPGEENNDGEQVVNDEWPVVNSVQRIVNSGKNNIMIEESVIEKDIQQNIDNKNISRKKEEEFRPLTATVINTNSQQTLPAPFRSMLISIGIGAGLAILALIVKKRFQSHKDLLSGRA
jgi:hypothetical protein